MQLRQLFPAIVVGLLLLAGKVNPTPQRVSSIPPRAAQIGDQLVLVIPQEMSDPGDRRPH